MKLRPTGNKVLVLPTPPPTKIRDIVLAQTWAQPTGRGRVIRAGSAVTDVKPGDVVVYNWINGREVEHEGVAHRILHASEIIGVLAQEQAPA